jgi:hypothetical protein
MLDRLRNAGFESIETPEPYDDFSPAERARFGLEPSPTIIAH